MPVMTESVATEEVFMHVWPVPTLTSDGTRRESAHEVELIGSHTADPNHLDPSCSACHQLRSRLQAMARMAVERVAPSAGHLPDLDIYYDPGCIVCSPSGQRPCVTVSIYVHVQQDHSPSTTSADTVSQLKNILYKFGVREK